uniref:DJ-1/PfpI domain-containing protein n=1 Tax=Panagrolaimus sp. ES5 TaxID=591445 RepID=A0AC34G3Z8_9BILA
MAPHVLILGFNDTEETELIISLDILRRSGVDVTLASLENELTFICVQKTKITADNLFKNLENNEYDAVVIPGGPGSKNAAEHQALGTFLQRHEKAGKILGAICGAPFVFANNGIGKGGAITSFPPEKDEILKKGDYEYREENVVVSKNIVTSRAPGTAFEFPLKLTELLIGKDKADEVGKKLLIIQ